MNKKIVKISLIANAVFITAALSAGGYYLYEKNKSNSVSEKEATTAKAKASLTVAVKNPTQEILPLKINITGNVSPWQESIIGSEISGLRLDSIFVDVGQVVQKNQVLATLKSQTVQADYNQAKSGVSEANANLTQAKENANRARTLDKTNALSSQQMTQYLTAEATAFAKLESAKALLEGQRVRLEQTKILSPEAGVISARNASVGSLVSSNSGELFRIVIKEKFQWKPQLSSDEIGLVKKGQDVSIKTKSGEILNAKVSEISPIVNEQTRQGTLLVNLDKSTHQNKIKPGMFLDGTISLGSSHALMVEQQAVVLRDGFNYVFVLKPDNKVSQTKVMLGLRNNNKVEIKSGLEASDKVVITGATFLNDQDTVRVSEALDSKNNQIKTAQTKELNAISSIQTNAPNSDSSISPPPISASFVSNKEGK